MKDLKQLLADGDPVAREAGASPIEAASMRRVILAAVVESMAPVVNGRTGYRMRLRT